MSDQLATDIRGIVDGAPPITLAELELASLAGMPPRPRRRWPVLAAAAAAVILIAGGVVFAGTRHDADRVIVPAGPAPSAPAPAPPAPATTSLGAPEVQGPDAASTLLTSWAELHAGYSYVYADGRVIWHSDRSQPADPYAWEGRLNSAGLDLVQSGDLTAEDFVRGYVPPDVWAVPQKAGYTASEYAACLWQESADPSDLFRDATNRLGDLPAPAQALLHTRRMFDGVQPQPASACFALTPEEARAVLDLNGPQPGSSLDQGVSWVVLIPASTNDAAIGLMVFPILPHGKILFWGA